MHDLSTALNLSSHQTKTHVQQRYSKTLNIDSLMLCLLKMWCVIQISVAKLETYLTANLPSFLFLLRSESCIDFGEARKTLSTVDGISKAWETLLSMASFGPMAKESAKGASIC